MRLVWIVLAGCSAAPISKVAPPTKPPPVEAEPPPFAPTAEQLGWLAVVPSPTKTSSWIPMLDPKDNVTAFLPEPWAGPSYGEERFPPEPVVIDSAGTRISPSYGDPDMSRDYCGGYEHGLVPVHADQPLKPGVAWLSPKASEWSSAPIAIQTRVATPERRVHAIGPVGVEVVRTTRTEGVMRISWNGKVVREQELGRLDADVDLEAPIDVLHDRPVPQVEAAWSLGEGAVLVVFRVPFGGVHWKFDGVVVNRQTAYDAMIMVLCYGAPGWP